MQQRTTNHFLPGDDAVGTFSSWTFCAGLNLSIIGCAALMVNQFNPCFALCLPVGYCFAATFCMHNRSDPSEFWPYMPRCLLGCVLTAVVMLGLCLAVM